MPTTNVLALGALAGLTIFLGLPVAFLKRGRRLKNALNATSIGILLFLLIDVATHGWEPVKNAVANAYAGQANWGAASMKLTIFAAGILAGLLSLVWFEYQYIHKAKKDEQGNLLPLAPATLSMMIAVGIGLHNFSEGLAIGASAATGAITFAALVTIGFALHNATEGFGIAAPLHGTKPTWSFLLLAGLIRGGPTFVGAYLGSRWTNDYLYIAFLALAAGALLFVIKELLHHARRIQAPREAFTIMTCVTLGLLLGFATDLIVSLGGG